MSLVKLSSVASVLAFALSLAVAPGCSSPATDSGTTTREITGKIDVSSYDLDNPNVVAESEDGRFFAAPLAADGSFSLNIPSKQAYRLLLTNTTFSGSYNAISYIQWQTEVGYTAWAYCDDGGSIGVGTVKPPPGEVSCSSCAAGKAGKGGGAGSGSSGKGSGDSGKGSGGDSKGGSGDSKGGSGSGDCNVEVSVNGGGVSVSGDCGGWSWDGTWGHSGGDDDDKDNDNGSIDYGGSDGKGGGGAGCSSCSANADAGASGSGKGGGDSSGKGGGNGKGGGKGGGPATPAGADVCDDLGKVPAPPVSHCGAKAPHDVHGQAGKGGGKGGKGGGYGDGAACTKPAPPPPPAPPVAKPGDACHVNAECGSAMFCCGSQCVAQKP